LPSTPYSYFFRLVYLLSVYGFVFRPALSCGLLDIFSLGGSLQNQEVNVFSSNSFEDLKLVGFALQFGCSKARTGARSVEDKEGSSLSDLHFMCYFRGH
jgi:hypothetical protein